MRCSLSNRTGQKFLCKTSHATAETAEKPPANKTSRGSRSPRENFTDSRALHVPMTTFFPSPISTQPYHTSTVPWPSGEFLYAYRTIYMSTVPSSAAIPRALRVVGALLRVTPSRKRGEPKQGRDGMGTQAHNAALAYSSACNSCHASRGSDPLVRIAIRNSPNRNTA